MRAWVFALCAAALASACATGVAAESRAPVAVAKACARLVGRYPDIVDSPTRVVSASLAPARGGLPAYCDVHAIIAPAIGVQLRMPSDSWNGGFFEITRPGFCRPVTMEDCDGPLSRGYACTISDQGNRTPKQDDAWQYDNLKAQVDCAFRAAHVTASAGKALVRAFYGVPAAHNYLMGCSTGGRMALMEAERFPHDFDGVIAGAAPVSKFRDSLILAWAATTALNADGKSLLSTADLQALHAAALKQCDGADGLRDGLISAPFACRFDPAVIRCANGPSAGCLGDAQVEAARRIYAGPTDSRGVSLYAGGPLPGSELNWSTYLPTSAAPSPVHESMTALFRYLNHPARGPRWRLEQLEWTQDLARLDFPEAMFGAANPDLRPFKAAGGKLIIFQGLTDEFVMPGNIVDFYEAVQRIMGGAAATREFARLFLVPGMDHCAGGDGAGVIDYVDALERWVEQDDAPDVMIASHPARGGSAWAPAGLPLDPATVAFTRPVYPYPATTHYIGKGAPNLAANFGPALGAP